LWNLLGTPTLVEFVSINPYSSLMTIFQLFYAGIDGVKAVLNNRQQSYRIARVFPLFKTLNLYLSCHEPWFVIIKALRLNLDLVRVMYSGLSFV
jgi:hypothetical protein